MKNVAIIGGTGFGGLGLIDIILRHPQLKLTQIIARQDQGKPLSAIFPHLQGYCDLPIRGLDEVDYSSLDLVFFSTPDRVGMQIIRPFYDAGIPVIDFSGDFRFKTKEEYEVYARNKGMATEHLASDLLTEAVYGMPELFAEEISRARIVGNPGCLATGMILGLLPATKAGIITSEVIYCDGKTGVSGAGRNAGSANLYPQRYENINPYREGHHQHLVETENMINYQARGNKKVLFIPHVVPMCRGISISMFAEIAPGIDPAQLKKLYEEYYKDSPFVLISDSSPETAHVKGTNRCLIRPMLDQRTGRLYISAVLDNLLKGQSGNAIHVANLMLGFPGDTGLGRELAGYYP